MRKVMIATPSFDGSTDYRYTAALVASVKLCLGRGIDLLPVCVGHGPVETLRDDLLAIAAQSDVSDVIWIDADIEWAPEWLLRLLDHPCDVVGGTYRRKDDGIEAYVVGGKPAQLVADAAGLMQVDHLGCGFLRLSRRAFLKLWESGAPYRIAGIDGKAGERRKVFGWDISTGERRSEDIGMCRQLRAAGFTINLDPAMCCNHSGAKTWGGDFAGWAARVRTEAAKTAAKTQRHGKRHRRR